MIAIHGLLVCAFSLAPQSATVPCTVLVRDSFGGKPVQDGELRWIPFDAKHFAQTLVEPDDYEVLIRDDFFAEGPALGLTDCDGRAKFERPDERGYVCVSAPGERGCAKFVQGRVRETEISVFRDWPVDVVVDDPSGAPLDGLGVCLRYSAGSSASSLWFDAQSTSVPLEGGRARLEHAGFLEGRIGYDRKFSVGLTGWLGKPVQVEIPTARPQEGSVKIAVPPSAALELSVLDDDGKVAAPIGALWIGERESLSAESARHDGPHAGPGKIGVTGGDGRFVFEHVQVGAPLRACACRNDRSAFSITELVGAEHARERKRAEFRLGFGCVSLRGRVSWPDGAPFVGRDLRYRFVDSKPVEGDVSLIWRFRELPLDSRGRFVVDLDPDSLAGPGRALELSWMKLLSSSAFVPDRAERERTLGTTPLAASVALDPLWSVGSHDLGELKLESIPFFASGIAIDARTKLPLAGVSVHAVDGKDSYSEPLVTSAATGRFELHAWCAADAKLDLEFFFPGASQSAKRVSAVARGTRDLVVELER